jgi:PAS domain S-box-containing protein
VIQAKRKEEQSLRQAVQWLFGNNPHPMYIYDTQTLMFLAVNRAAVEHYGYTESEFLRMTIKDIRPPEDVPRLLAWAAEIGAEVCRSGLRRHQKKDGTIIQVEITSHGLQFGGRRARVVQANDVTARMLADARLRDSEQRWRTLAAATFEGIAISQAGRFVDVNEQLARMSGYGREELLGKEIALLIPGEEHARVLENIRAGRESRIEHEIVRKDGTRVTVEAHGQTVEMEGRPMRFTTVRDITKRKRTEEALSQQVDFRQRVFNSTDAHLAVVQGNGQILEVNDAWRFFAESNNAGEERTWGPGANYFRTATREAGDTAGAQEAYEGIRQVQQGWRPHFELEYPCHSPKEQRWFAMRVFPLLGRPGTVLVSHTNVTARKQAERALQAQNRRLALLNEAATQLLSTEETERAMGKVYERIAGYFQTSGFFEFEIREPGDQLRLKSCLGVGEPYQECGTTSLRMGEGIVGTVAQQRQSIVLQQVQQSDDPKTELLRKLGVQAYACYPLVVGERLLGTLSFASRKRESFEEDDAKFFETLASYVALAEERLRLKRELQRHALSLEQAVEERTGKLQELVADLEHMSYSITHDMRAPLRAMQGFATIIVQQEGERLSSSSRDLLERMVTSTKRMDLLITEVLNYGQAVRAELPSQPVDVGTMLRNLLRSYPQFEPTQVEVRLEGEFPPVLGNEAGLTQCFSNLLNNAVKFVNPGSKSQVRVWAEVKREPAMVRVWVEDNGLGIPRENQEKIFHMFQRLHGPEYDGTGIGLALVRKVAERMGGQVGVESEVGQGSRFWLELPAAGDQDVKRAARPAGTQSPS